VLIKDKSPTIQRCIAARERGFAGSSSDPCTALYLADARRFSDVAVPGRAVKLLFWLCLVLISYTYFGYAIYLWLYVRLRRSPIFQSPVTPSISIVIAARNEETRLPAKLEIFASSTIHRKKFRLSLPLMDQRTGPPASCASKPLNNLRHSQRI